MNRIKFNFTIPVEQLSTMLPEAEFNALWAEGKSMTMEQAIRLALVQ